MSVLLREWVSEKYLAIPNLMTLKVFLFLFQEKVDKSSYACVAFGTRYYRLYTGRLSNLLFVLIAVLLDSTSLLSYIRLYCSYLLVTLFSFQRYFKDKICARYLSRFLVRLAHETTDAPKQWKSSFVHYIMSSSEYFQQSPQRLQSSDFQSPFSPLKTSRIFLKKPLKNIKLQGHRTQNAIM